MDNGEDNYRRYLNGDDNGLIEIVRMYYDPLVLFLLQTVENPDVAEDLAEDTFLRLCIRKPRYKNEASFKTWLYTIARNLAIDYLRKNKRNVPYNSDDLVCKEELYDTVANAYCRKESKLVVQKAMHSIKKEYAQVLFLTYFENLSNKETAKILKKSVHAVENLNYRARLALKNELEKEGFIYEDL